MARLGVDILEKRHVTKEKEEMIEEIDYAIKRYIGADDFVFIERPQERFLSILESYMDIIRDDRIQLCKHCKLPAFKEDLTEGYCNRLLCKQTRLVQGRWVGPKKRKTKARKKKGKK